MYLFIICEVLEAMKSVVFIFANDQETWKGNEDWNWRIVKDFGKNLMNLMYKIKIISLDKQYYTTRTYGIQENNEEYLWWLCILFCFKVKSNNTPAFVNPNEIYNVVCFCITSA